MALDHSDKIDWEDLDADDAVDAALLVKRDKHERYESDEATVDVVDSKDGSARCYILADYDAESPREWDNAGHMVCWHRHYNLGDKHKFYDPEDFEETAKDWKGNDRIAVILSLYLYDHSGITMSCSPFSCPWDSGQVGYIYLTRGDAIARVGIQAFDGSADSKAKVVLESRSRNLRPVPDRRRLRTRHSGRAERWRLVLGLLRLEVRQRRSEGDGGVGIRRSVQGGVAPIYIINYRPATSLPRARTGAARQVR